MCRQRLLLRRHRQMTQLSDDTRCTRRTSSTRHMMRLSPLQHAGERACEYREYRVCDVCVCLCVACGGVRLRGACALSRRA